MSMDLLTQEHYTNLSTGQWCCWQQSTTNIKLKIYWKYVHYRSIPNTNTRLMYKWMQTVISLKSDDRGSTNPWNTGTLTPIYMAQRPRRQPSWHSPLWETQIILSYFTTAHQWVVSTLLISFMLVFTLLIFLGWSTKIYFLFASRNVSINCRKNKCVADNKTWNLFGTEH
jgi:hypothetical protein